MPSTRLQWIDARGKPIEMPWKARWSWVWENDASPALRLEIEAKSDVKILSVKSRPGNPELLDGGRKIRLDMNVPESSLQVSYQEPPPKGSKEPGKEQSIGALVQVEPFDGGAFWLHSTCDDQGIKVENVAPVVAAAPSPTPAASGKPLSPPSPTPAAAAPNTPPVFAKFLFLALKCDPKGLPKSWNVKFIPSGDAFLKDLPAGDTPEVTYPRPEKLEVGQLIGSFGIGSKMDPKRIMRRELRYRPDSRFSLNAGLGLTFLSYGENPRDIKLTQLGVTPKIGAVFRLTPKFDLGLSSFVTLFPIFHSPSSEPWARFYGVNARVGYRLGVQWFGAKWTVNLGWYWWGMAVKDDFYGVSQLAGPQLFLVMDQFEVKRPYWAYLKIAPTAESISGLGPGNRELAIGGGMRITNAAARHRVDLTLDLSNTTFTAKSVGLDMAMTTITLGAQMDLSRLIFRR